MSLHLLFGPPNIKKMREKKDRKGLARAMEYSHGFGIRYPAARALAELADETCLQAFERALQSGDLQLQQIAAQGLGASGSPEALPILLKALAEDCRPTLRAASDRLGQPGAAAKPQLSAWVQDLNENFTLRMLSAEALIADPERETNENERPEAAFYLLNTLKKEPARIRAHFVELLTASAKDLSDEEVRQRALTIFDKAQDEAGKLVTAILRAAGQLNAVSAAQTVRPFLQDPHESVRQQAALTLQKLGQPLES